MSVSLRNVHQNKDSRTTDVVLALCFFFTAVGPTSGEEVCDSSSGEAHLNGNWQKHNGYDSLKFTSFDEKND